MPTKIPVQLLVRQRTHLDSMFGRSKSSFKIGKRAIEIVKIHFRKEHPGCTFEVEKDDADLVVHFASPKKKLLIEIKGTASLGVAFGQLKVSGDPSYKMLVKKKIPVYRVSDVLGKDPVIRVLKYGVDFGLKREPRWRFETIKSASKSGSTRKRPTTGALSKKPKTGRNSKYAALTKLLSKKKGNTVYLRFADAKKCLGFSLPASAFTHAAFWANQSDVTNRPHAKAWQEAGFYVDEVKLSARDGWARFKRDKL